MLFNTCSMTSGAIQHGVPTNVCRTLSRTRSLPVANQALTPKSAIITEPSWPNKMLPALMSLQNVKENNVINPNILRDHCFLLPKIFLILIFFEESKAFQ